MMGSNRLRRVTPGPIGGKRRRPPSTPSVPLVGPDTAGQFRVFTQSESIALSRNHGPGGTVCPSRNSTQAVGMGDLTSTMPYRTYETAQMRKE